MELLYTSGKYCDVLPGNASNNLWVLDFMLGLLDIHQAEFTLTYYTAAEVRGRARGLASGICGGQSGVGADFLRVFLFPLPKPFIPPTSPSSSQLKSVKEK
jgi:hypothetical protein